MEKVRGCSGKQSDEVYLILCRTERRRVEAADRWTGGDRGPGADERQTELKQAG